MLYYLIGLCYFVIKNESYLKGVDKPLHFFDYMLFVLPLAVERCWFNSHLPFDMPKECPQRREGAIP
jgi:hypothetical protein